MKLVKEICVSTVQRISLGAPKKKNKKSNHDLQGGYQRTTCRNIRCENKTKHRCVQCDKAYCKKCFRSTHFSRR